MRSPELTRREALIALALVGLGLGALAWRGPGAPAPDAAPARLDLNTATQDELRLLPGVNARQAERLVAGRPYASVDDARAVLGDDLFARVAPHLAVAPITTSR